MSTHAITFASDYSDFTRIMALYKLYYLLITYLHCLVVCEQDGSVSTGWQDATIGGLDGRRQTVDDGGETSPPCRLRRERRKAIYDSQVTVTNTRHHHRHRHHHIAHQHANSDHLTATCFPSQQTTQCLPAVPSVQLLLISGTVYHCPFEQHHLSTPSDDT